MVNFFNLGWNKILELGTSDNSEHEKRMRIQMTNRVYLFSSFFSLIYFVFLFLIGHDAPAMVVFGMATTCSLLLVLNYFQLYGLGKIIYVLASNFCIYYFSYLGFASGVHLYVLLSPFIIFSFFDRKEVFKIIFSFVFFFITFIVIMTVDNSFIYPANYLSLMQSKMFYIGNVFFIVILCTVLIAYLINSNSKKNLELLRMALNAEKLQKNIVASEYESLKSQMNPHFLFNSLNVLMELVYLNQKDAARFVMELSEVYRYILDIRKKEVVHLSTEISFINSYAYLLKIRFDSNLTFKISIKENRENTMIAPLALQVLVENAIKHNIISKKEPLIIAIYIEDKYIVVENNLQKKENPERKSGFGLNNLKSRYNFLTEEQVLVMEGTKDFVVKVPQIFLQT